MALPKDAFKPLRHIILIIKWMQHLIVAFSDFSKICQQSGTEFHFPDLDKQLCIIQQNFEKRERTKSTSSNQPQQQQPAADVALRPITLNTG